MKKNLTELVFIIDESGSMSSLIADTIGGFNSMIDKQKKEEGDCMVSLVLFNQGQKVLFDRVSIENIPKMTEDDYCPSGSTALVDAIGGAIHHIGNVHKYSRDEDRPEHTIFIITTDGMENASCRYNAKRVRHMVERQKTRYGWEFLFLAANIDAVETARHYGIHESRTARYHHDAKGVSVNYYAMGEAIHTVRSGNVLDRNWKKYAEMDFEERENQK
jgi:uncharacterized protein YegL